MARLIPRKQIEEQQNISGSFAVGGSLTVGEDLVVTGNSIVTGSFQVDNDFFLGDALTDRGEITGSVFITGSLEIDGTFQFGETALLATTSSVSLQSVDTQRFEGIRAKDFGANVPTLYVSSTDGDDTNDGRTIQFPLRTIKRAAQLSQPGYDGRYGFDTGSIFNGYVIKVQAGTYLEDNPVILPANTTIWGSGLRITKVNAKNPEQDLFWVNSGCYIAEITMGGLRLWPDQINPERGFGVAFQPGAFITTSPYVQNCSQISNQENSFTELYEDIPPGGGGLYVNGDVVDPDSPLASMVLDAYTQISPNGVGCLVNGRGFIQLVSFFTNFSYYAIRVNNGGHATLNNSNISFGLYGMYASGSRQIDAITGGDEASREKVRESYSIIVDTLNKGLEDGLPDVTVLNTDEGIKVTSETQYIGDDTDLNTRFGTNQATDKEVEEIRADFNLVSAIVESGTTNFPTLIARSSTKGYGFDSPYNILGAEQITGSVSASQSEVDFLSSSFGVILGIFADGTGSYNLKLNTSESIKVTEFETTLPSTLSTYSSSLEVSSSFSTIITILKNGVAELPTEVLNTSASIVVTETQPNLTGISSSLEVRTSVSESFSIVYNILANGTGSSILDIPSNHQREYAVSKNSTNTAYVFGITGSGNVENADLTLFRGETYKFFVSAGLGPDAEPFFIRTSPESGFREDLNYDDGVVNNGDSNGTITFSVPYDAPNTLYYVSQDTSNFGGTFSIVNSSTTPKSLILGTLTYPETVPSSSLPSEDVDVINAYDLLVNNKDFIKDETIAYLSSSWSDFDYNQETCKRDIGFIVDGVAKDILYGGNEESIRSGFFYYLYPSEATTTQLSPTLTAVKYVSNLSQKLLQNTIFNEPDTLKLSIKEAILDNREFIQNETIAYLSSSWRGFQYNEEKCKRDVGYILDAVATDTLYGGNERAIEAGVFYYLYPSDATGSQLNQTIDGIKYAAGTTLNVIEGKTFQTASDEVLGTYNILIDNKELIQNETIEFINVAYPTLEYNQSKCRRDVGYILDAVSTDLLYGGNESSVRAGRYYYDYPSIATSTQKVETAGGIRYAKIISEFIVTNQILDTPRIIYNDERLIKVTNQTNITSSVSGTNEERALITSSFNIMESIIRRGVDAIPSILAQNTGLSWSVKNPLNVSSTQQITSSFVEPNELDVIEQNFDIVTSIIEGGVGASPILTASYENLIKVTDGIQITGSSVSPSVTSSISSSFAIVADIIFNGTGSIPSLVENTSASIKVTSTTQYTSALTASSTEVEFISSSMGTIIDVLTNGLSVLPTLIQNTSASIKVSDVVQFTGSLSASLEDIEFVSSSISIVTKILEGGYGAAPIIEPYVSASITPSTLAAYEIIKENIDFIQDETIAYLSSSWSEFEYDESKCRRDVGLIVSGAAEDLLFGANSASVVSGIFYLDYPSEATGSQLAQTLDGINYASRITQKLVQNILFVTTSQSTQNGADLFFNNKEFIQNETIAYISSSWGEFEYVEATCKRDIGYIIDAIRTDLVYGGNERTRVAGEYYYRFPSEATGEQLIQTTDAISYASRLAQKLVVGDTFVSADSDNIVVSNLLFQNRDLIANEVVEYVSSSWSDVFYNENTCKRDVKYIIDAVRTDLVYGGNERASVAGDFYFRFPSSATVGGVPSSTQQRDPTITGINYGNQLAQSIALSRVLVSPSQAILNARDLVRENRSLIQDNVIEYVGDTYPSLRYDVGRCRRDVGFIIDNVLTDLVWGGNERSITAGVFYYLYPSQATGTQVEETVDAINFGRDLTKLIALGGKAIEDSFDNVANIIQSGSSAIPELVSNTEAGIKVTANTQITSSISVENDDVNVVSSSFGTVIDILSSGTGSLPTKVLNSERGIIVNGNTQITSSITPSQTQIDKVGSGFDIVLDVVENGTGSLPTLVTNVNDLIKVTDTTQFTSSALIASSLINKATSSFDIVLDIVENGTGSLPSLVDNTVDLVKITTASQYIPTETIYRPTRNAITASFDRIITILENGTGSLPTLVSNTNSNRKVTSTSQYISASSATAAEATSLSSSFATVIDIIVGGPDVAPVIVDYTTPSTDPNVIVAYEILKNNIQFIQDETIAYISSSWRGFEYNEASCSRDVGLIVSGAAEDLLWNANSASVTNGLFYWEFPSQANGTGSQVNQTVDGVRYAGELAQKVILNTLFVTASSEISESYNSIVNNREFIQDEVIEYISSSWSTHQYNQETCKRDVGYILDAVATDTLYGGNQRSIEAGRFYYLYPSEATGSQIEETVTGIEYAKKLTNRILQGGVFTTVASNKLEAKDLVFNNREFIQNEVISYVSASWSTADYNEDTCKRDVGYILDAVVTDFVYGGNERSIEAGTYYYLFPSEATNPVTQLGPTLSGIRYAKGLTQNILEGDIFVTASLSKQTAYDLLFQNRTLIQDEVISYVSSSWSGFEYNEASCSRDVGYILDAVATDILYGGNERVREAGEYYYLYPSLAIVEGDGDGVGQLGQTLDGIRYAKGIAQKLVQNTLLVTASQSETTVYNLLLDNKEFIQAETIAFLSSSWSGVDGFFYNEASCSRDVGYIIDAVATDVLYGGNERSITAGEYYYEYPSRAIVDGSGSPDAQLGQTVDGVTFAAGIADKIVQSIVLEEPTQFVSDFASILRQNISFIQNETIQYIDAFFPFLRYNREKCRRDVGYILDAVITDLTYGGNQRSITAGNYYYLYPNLATTNQQVVETVAGVEYAKAVSKAVALNQLLSTVSETDNTNSNIKVTQTEQYTSSLSVSDGGVATISSSFATVMEIISGGIEVIPTVITNTEDRIKVTNTPQITSSITGSITESGIVTASFNLIRDIIYWGSESIPDALASNFNYGFEKETPDTLHITSVPQTLSGETYTDGELVSQLNSVSSSYGTIIDILVNGLDVLPNLVSNTSSSLRETQTLPTTASISGSETEVGRIGNLFGIVLDVIENGTSAIPSLIPNTSSSIKVTDTPQIVSGSSADRLQARLISASFGIVIDALLNNGTASVDYEAPSPTPNSNQKIISAYNLLLDNTGFIQNETIAFMSSSWSEFVYNEESCSRDIGLIISGAAFDLLYGGNSASLTNGKYYFDFPSEATSSQLDQTVTALRYAGGVAEKVVRNIQFTSITSSLLEPISASYNLLRLNKGFIQSESIAYLSSSWSEFEYNQATCVRDIGYIIDAVSTDILYGGNERSIVAGDYYYRFPSQATDSQLEPTLTGVRYAKGTAMNVVVNTPFQTSSAETQYAYDLLRDNKVFIQSESVAYIDAKYPDFIYNRDTCRRDVGFIVDAVATDLKWGGNERSSKAGEFYYLYPSQATGTQVEETSDAIRYAALLSAEIVKNDVIPTPTPVLNTSASIKVTQTPQYLTGSEFGTAAEALLVSQSFSLVEQILELGTGSILETLPLPTSSYTTPSTDLNVIYAYNLVQQNIPFIQAETIAYISSSWSEFEYNEASCSRDVGLIVSGAIEDLLFGSLSASVVNGKFYYEYPSAATGSQLQQTLDGIRYANRITQKVLQNVEFITASVEVSASYNLLRDNKLFIQNETIAFLSSSWSEFSYSQSTCIRDIGYIVDAVSTDLLYGGNERSAIAGDYYYRYPSEATTTQLEPTVTAVDYAGGVGEKVVRGLEFVTASDERIIGELLLELNKPFIQDETLAYLTASWSTFEYDKDKCRRDVGYIVDAVKTDFLYGGNERSVEAGRFYYLYPSLATVAGTTNGQLEETIDGINYARRVAQKVVQNIEFVTASSEVSASFDLIRKNKEFIAAETIEYVSSSWSGVYYNQASCSRDVGYLLDAAATDLLYGGQERSVIAGKYYYLFPSRATNAGVPSEQNQLDPTTTGVRYAGKLASNVILNPEYQTPSASALVGRELLVGNKTFIQKETIAFLSSSWSSLQYNEISCSRDLGFIIDAVGTDLIYGGNERSIEAGSFYYRIPSVAIEPTYSGFGRVGQREQTVDGINFGRGVAEKVVDKEQLVFPGTLRREAVQRLVAAKDTLKKQAIGYTNGAFPYLVYNEASCSRDTGLIVDAVATDLLYGGNERGIAAAESYFNGQYGNADEVIFNQRTETLETNRYLRTRVEFIAANAPKEDFGSLIVATGIDYSYNGSGVTFKALPPNQGGSGVADPAFEITELGGGRIFFTSGNQDGDFRIGTGLSINQATGTLVGRTFSRSLFTLITPFSIALRI